MYANRLLRAIVYIHISNYIKRKIKFQWIKFYRDFTQKKKCRKIEKKILKMSSDDDYDISVRPRTRAWTKAAQLKF